MAHDGVRVPAVTVVIATRSEGKIRELRAMFATVGAPVHTLTEIGLPELAVEESLEVFASFEENALAKARWFYERLVTAGNGEGNQRLATSTVLVVADDSGLEVDALGGAPGVRSKRWSGQTALTGVALDAANNAHLQAALQSAERHGHRSRSARYVCAAACVWSGGEIVTRGSTEGTLLVTARGDGGFGYDPYFRSDDLGITFAEASRDAKAAVSHRGRAFTALLARVGERGVLAPNGGVKQTRLYAGETERSSSGG